MLRRAWVPEGRTFDGFLEALEDDPADAIVGFFDDMACNAKTCFRIEGFIWLAQAQAAARDFSDASPFAGDDAEDVSDQLLCGDIALAADGSCIWIFHLGPAFLQLFHAHIDSLQNIERFKARLRRCRGQITAVIACRTDPGTVFVLKGNRPLELRWHPRRKAVLYASDPAYLDVVLAEEKGWREIAVPPMSMVVFRRENLSGYSVEPFEFVAQERKGAEP